MLSDVNKNSDITIETGIEIFIFDAIRIHGVESTYTPPLEGS